MRLAAKEEKYLELELVQDEISKLIERSQKQSRLGQGHTLSLAKQISDCQAKINDISRKTKATVSELCMYQVCLVLINCYSC